MSVPVRTCIVTKQRHNKFDMVRIVYFNDYVKVDPTFKEKGRGVYVLPDLTVFDEGILKHRIEQGLKLKRTLEQVEVLRLKQEFEEAVKLREQEALEEHQEKIEELRAEEENKPTNI
ncbi:hypothetical protein DOJK_02403 [Patescibacteria group bacterium]|nr:YlxR family protein [Candidatus Dojkabacteria bacterium]CAG1023480.1 hypothetical protein DOJK_02403 [Patescibacteria group bacterium]